MVAQAKSKQSNPTRGAAPPRVLPPQLACGPAALGAPRTCIPDGRQQEVVRQELQHRRLHMVAQAVHLQAALVVDVHVLLLRRREERLVVQELDVARRLAHLHLGHQRRALPVHERDVAAHAAHQHVAPAAREVQRVGAQLGEVEVKRLARGARVHHLDDLLLLEVPGALHACAAVQRMAASYAAGAKRTAPARPRRREGAGWMGCVHDHPPPAPCSSPQQLQTALHVLHVP